MPYELCKASQEFIFAKSWLCRLSLTSKLFSLKVEPVFMLCGDSYAGISKGGISSKGFFRVPDVLVAKVAADALL